MIPKSIKASEIKVKQKLKSDCGKNQEKSFNLKHSTHPRTKWAWNARTALFTNRTLNRRNYHIIMVFKAYSFGFEELARDIPNSARTGL